MNINPREFARINPCGLPASTMISMKELGVVAEVSDVETAKKLALELGLTPELISKPPEVPQVAEELKPVRVAINA